jgi:D-alanine-D-alanine ligase
MLEFALRSLRPYGRRLHKLPLGVMFYADEGLDCRYSNELIHRAAGRASRVLVLRPSNPNGRVIDRPRGLRKYRLTVEGRPRRPGQAGRTPEVLNLVMAALQRLPGLGSRQERVAVSTVDLHSEALPMMLPHRIRVTILLSYPDKPAADTVEARMREVLSGNGLRWSLELDTDRPPMKERRVNSKLVREFGEAAADWEIPFERESSTGPSVAGLVPGTKPVLCGLAPAARDLYTPNEAVERISLVQRTLLLAQYLASQL